MLRKIHIFCLLFFFASFANLLSAEWTSSGYFKDAIYDAVPKDESLEISDIGFAVNIESPYSMNVYGQMTSAAVIESGLPMFDHVAFANTTLGETYLPDGAYGGAQTHATSVASVIAAYDNDFFGWGNYGIAPLTKIYAGSISSDLQPDGSFSVRYAHYYNAHKHFFADSPVDLVNYSFGGNVSADNDAQSLMLDAFAYSHAGTLAVIASGNLQGDATRTLSPGLSFNSITVGALGNPHEFNELAPYSLGGPSDFYNPITKELIKNVRASVDICAPGTNIVVAGFDDETVADNYYVASGTSFAAPVVSGAALLLKSASYQLGWNETTRDSRLIKAILLNSARKSNDWDNGMRLQNAVTFTSFYGSGITVSQNYDNVKITTQSLDYLYGAGNLDIGRAFDEYVFDLGANAWALGDIALEEELRFALGFLESGQTLRATLVWFVQVLADYENPFTEENPDFALLNSAMANLDLELWYEESGVWSPLAASRSIYNDVEHIYLLLENSANYELRIKFENMVYGTLQDEKEIFALAYAVPEPSTYAAIFGALVLALAVCKSKRKGGAHSRPAPRLET